MADGTPCIEGGNRNQHGYARVSKRVNGRVITRYAHRLAWEAEHGPIPEGMMVLHRCDNPPCVNVNHLFLGTQKDNMGDAASKGRLDGRKAEQTHCKRGHEFTEENTYLYRRMRTCRACRALRKRLRG